MMNRAIEKRRTLNEIDGWPQRLGEERRDAAAAIHNRNPGILNDWPGRQRAQ